MKIELTEEHAKQILITNDTIQKSLEIAAEQVQNINHANTRIGTTIGLAHAGATLNILKQLISNQLNK